ncbi:transporter substrate-binding domain-containing protein [Synechocystis sp. FACHB-383]|uniref:transporter substrate-binding domain-containing protein n=1 Tax=Synechocystis sp. FACHB-383 TaxID=2692864 RepID=UPI001689FDEE|nr:transporter substrate-binding domain-containing protein [Synechocystis sp. FACHB-383]MBD2652232.1 transporter substrate-binding domain-containing protein [Synechocystis sp. FACHB-383]
MRGFIVASCLLFSIPVLTVSVTAQTMADSMAMASRDASLEAIRQRGKLRVGVKDNLRPLGFRNDQGELAGLEITLAHRLALALLGNEKAVELIPVQNQDRLALLLNGDVDLIIAQMGQNPARDRLVDFSPPYYMDGVGLISKNGSLKNLDRNQAHTIAVLNNSGTIAVLKQAFPQVNLVGVDSYDQAYQLLEQGQALAFAGDNSVLSGWSQSQPDYYHSPLQLTINPLAIAMAKGLQHQALQREVNQILLKLRASGWLRQQWQAWGLPF